MKDLEELVEFSKKIDKTGTAFGDVEHTNKLRLK